MIFNKKTKKIEFFIKIIKNIERYVNETYDWILQFATFWYIIKSDKNKCKKERMFDYGKTF